MASLYSAAVCSSVSPACLPPCTYIVSDGLGLCGRVLFQNPLPACQEAAQIRYPQWPQRSLQLFLKISLFVKLKCHILFLNECRMTQTGSEKGEMRRDSRKGATSLISRQLNALDLIGHQTVMLMLFSLCVCLTWITVWIISALHLFWSFLSVTDSK